MEERAMPKVLIVDDEASNLGVLGLALKKHHFEFEMAFNGQEALEKARTFEPDLIYLDIHMPVMDGLEACRRLKADPATRHIPVVMITGVDEAEMKMAGLMAGANDFLNKPVDIPELITRSRNLLKLKEFEEVKTRNEFLREWEVTVNRIDDILVHVDGEGAIIRLNRALSRLTGRPSGDLAGRLLREVLRERGIALPEASAPSHEVQDNEGRWFLSQAYAVQPEESPSIRSVVTLREITPIKQAEELLRSSEERYRTLFNGLPLGLYRTTPEGKILAANPALMAMLGVRTFEELCRMKTSDVYVLPEDQVRWRTLMDYDREVRNFEVQWRRPDGRVIWVRESARSVFDSEGVLLCYEGVIENITEQKRIEEVLKETGDKFLST
jgi:PAS domain S-box-containing protein